MKKTRYCLITALLVCLCFSTGCAGLGAGIGTGTGTGTGSADDATATKRYEAEFLNLFDTYTKIVGYTTDEAVFKDQVQFIYDELQSCHQLYDIYSNYEGVNNMKTINDNAGVRPVKVDGRILDLLDFSRQVYDLTEGRVNVAFGSVLSVWHDYREAGMEDPQSAELPPYELLVEAAGHTGVEGMVIDRAASTVYLTDSDMRLDVGAVAKGYAVEYVSRRARQQKGVSSMLISVGGNVCAIGGKDGTGTAWTVGIQSPKGEAEADQEILDTVELADLSLVTSGDYQRYYTVMGKRYNHIIDPDTLMPAERFRSVSILCPDSGMADALSTAAFLMDMESGMSLISSIEGAEAIYVLPDGSTACTDGFPELLQK